jgi:hypothetical protein
LNIIRSPELSVNTLTVLETAAQVNWLAPQSNQRSLLAITPEAAYACQKLGQPYLKLEDYAQVLKRSGEYTPILNDYLQWETWLDEWAQQAIPEFGASGFRPASNASFLLQLLFAEVWSSSVSLVELLEALQPTQVALWTPEIIDVPWHLQPLVSALPALLPALACGRGIELMNLSEQAPALTPIAQVEKNTFSVSRFLNEAKRRLREEPLVVGLVKSGWTGLWEAIKPTTANAPHILFSGYSYDLETLVAELRRQGARITVLADILPPVRLLSQTTPIPSAMKQQIIAAGAGLLQEPKLWAPLEKWGLKHTPLWSKPLQFWWHQLVPELWLHYQQLLPRLQKRKFHALVTWDVSGSSLSSAVTNAAAVTGTPRYVYQHGGSSGSDAKLWSMYLQQSDTFLVYGQGTVDELVQSCPAFLPIKTQIQPVGSTRLDMLRRQYQPEKIEHLRTQLQAGDERPIIMYVPTCFGTYGRAISDLAAYPDVSYFELQQAILKLWQEVSDVRLLYKEFIVSNDPNSGIMRDFVETWIPGAIVTNQRLTDLMWAVDAIVVDHVITAVNEILLTNKPMVVYMPRPNSSSPQAKTLLQKRAVVAETPAAFIAEVRTLLQLGQFSELKNPTTEFLQIYGTHLDDGRSAERAAALILSGKNPN